MVFQIMYKTVRTSPNFFFRTLVLMTMEKMIPNYPTRAEQWSQGWSFTGKYFHIRADRVQNLKVDLQRIRWVEKLDQVGLFTFIPTTKRPDTWMTRHGKQMTQNQWMYGEVIKYIHPERIALFNRFGSRLNDPTQELGLPKQPDKYWILEFMNEPPKFVVKDTKEFHHFSSTLNTQQNAYSIVKTMFYLE